jgi:hypothetical protein
MQKCSFLDNPQIKKEGPLSVENSGGLLFSIMSGKIFIFPEETTPIKGAVSCRMIGNYLTEATSNLKVAGSFMARSARTLRSRPIPF